MKDRQIDFPLSIDGIHKRSDERANQFHKTLRSFNEFGKETLVQEFNGEGGGSVPVYINEFWTSKQRAAHPIHEISFRACFKPQVPRFFIERLTGEGDVVYDPFMGRGTTLVEAALLKRSPAGCDINPLSPILTLPRLNPPEIEDVNQRLDDLDLTGNIEHPEDFDAFYHSETLTELCNLRRLFLEKQDLGTLDNVDQWIRMVASNRLTGHSPGFFSVYSMPPNQAVSIKSQRIINERRQQVPPPRDVKAIIKKKSRALLSVDCEALRSGTKLETHSLFTQSCDHTPQIPSETVSLIITSPPFLDIVDYQTDNWLRCWFNGIDAKSVPIFKTASKKVWQAKMTGAFFEFHRILKPGAFIAFEVGEIRGGKLKMEDLVVPAGRKAGLIAELILINDQKFTKTANCWGIDNSKKGTNTNRLILFRKY